MLVFDRGENKEIINQQEKKKKYESISKSRKGSDEDGQYYVGRASNVAPVTTEIPSSVSGRSVPSSMPLYPDNGGCGRN